MKVIKLVLTLVIASFFANHSFSMNVKDETSVVAKTQDKVKIKKEELPLVIQNTLNGDSYKEWTFVNAYRVKDEYEVEVKKGDVTKTLLFDKEGNLKA